MSNFEDFAHDFFELFLQPRFRNLDFLRYLERPAPKRTGDEASIVDNAIVGPLLGLLGYQPGEQVYNQNGRNGRPDFAPTIEDNQVCFVAENKSTGLELNVDASDPGGHLAQLCRYLRSEGLRTGWLSNGVRLTVWRLDNPDSPTLTIDVNIVAAVQEWQRAGLTGLSGDTERSLRSLWEQFRRETFADWKRIEQELGIGLEEWRRQALPLGNNPLHQDVLVGAVKSLLKDLQADARRRLDGHLERYDDYISRTRRLSDDTVENASERLAQLRRRIDESLEPFRRANVLDISEIDGIRNDLRELERDPLAFLSTKELMAKTLDTINAARARKFAGDKNASRPWKKFDNGLSDLGAALEKYGDTAFEWHQRKALLGHDRRVDIEVRENYAIWTAVVQETMLGGLNEDQRRDEFALQAAYVVFIRLMLIRVCEDKGVLPNRFLSDGGLKRWQEDIERYFIFTNAEPYEPLLDMAYKNAQNIYAHFFTGRELFNWYTLDRRRFIRVLAQLSRFDFADVDSDLIGTIYNTYVERPEKKQKGQYYTPPEIVRYILDETGYVTGPAIIGPNKRLIDPACGSGSFLVEAARRLVAAYKNAGDNPRQLLDRVRDNLYGFDLNPFACYLAEVNLLIQVLDLVKPLIEGKHAPNLQRFHVYNVDALSPSSGILYYVQVNTSVAEEMDVVDRLKGRRGEFETGFAWVVANPPYGASLTETYKESLRDWLPEVFYGQPDTYVFFFARAVEWLATGGRLGFITPNTYLMGTNTASLRGTLLDSGRIDQIVDLPQGIWKDANVDCALLFLTVDSDPESRRARQVPIFSMDVRDKLDKLTRREWKETFTQPQCQWMDDDRHEMNIRWTPLLEQIEEACRVTVNGGPATKIQRLGDVVTINRGVEPYHSREQGKSAIFIKRQRELKPDEQHWKRLIDSHSYVGRYELRWSKERPHLNYGAWLYRAYEPVYFESQKLLFIRLRNRALHRRLVATFDDNQFYNRHNFSNIIAADPAYNLKYILALFNSSVLNYYYARQYPDVEISIADTRQLPIYPADASTQAEFVAMVDELLAKNAALNEYREKDYVIKTHRDGTRQVSVPYDVLLSEMQASDRRFPVLTLFDARAAGLVRLPDECDTEAQIGKVGTAERYPNRIVLRGSQLWLETDDADVRRYLLNYLARPQWKDRKWDEICGEAVAPENAAAFAALYAEEARIVASIEETIQSIADTDATLDERVLDLYGIVDPADRQRILGSAPASEDSDLDVEVTLSEDEAENGTSTTERDRNNQEA